MLPVMKYKNARQANGNEMRLATNAIMMNLLKRGIGFR